MPERDYSHRSTAQKLGVRPGSVVAVAEGAWPSEPALLRDLEAEAGRPVSDGSEGTDVVLVPIGGQTDAVSVLREWRERIVPAGGIWLLTPNRGQPGYVNQTDLIPAGAEAGLVDNKTCCVSATVSGMRFVIRKAER